VSTVLGVDVERFEDGKANSQVDALIHYPDRVAALEIVADHDRYANEQRHALNRKGRWIEVPGLRQAWRVVISRQASVNQVTRELPALLLAWQDHPPPEQPPWDAHPELDRLRISYAQPWEASLRAGSAYLSTEFPVGPAGDERTVAEWVTRVLGEHADVPAKLAAHPDVTERHAFLWTTPESDFGVQEQLERGDDHPFPATPPILPPGVTHVWVAGSAPDQGTLAWFPNRGWSRTPWMWPLDGPVELADQAD
jgi:hypothetical protein